LLLWLLVRILELVEPSMYFASRSIAYIHHDHQTMTLEPKFVRMEAYMDNLAFSYKCSYLARHIQQRIELAFGLHTNRHSSLGHVDIERVLFARRDKPYYIGMDITVAYPLDIHQRLVW
jgi:hypothetical protein